MSVPARVTGGSWQQQVFARATAQLAEGRPDPSEDSRTFDWRYLLNVGRRSRVLVVGSGFGFSACLFASMVGEVCVVDPDRDRLELTATRANSLGLTNVVTRRCMTLQGIEETAARFDLIVAGGPDLPVEFVAALDFERFGRAVWHLLRPGGTAQFSVRNPWSPLRGRGRYAATFHAGRRALECAGFGRVQVYAPLPHVDAAPLALVPLESTPAIRAFVRDLAVVFDTVSPEARARYGVLYPLARIGMQLVTITRATPLVRLFAPGYCFIASLPSTVAAT